MLNMCCISPGIGQYGISDENSGAHYRAPLKTVYSTGLYRISRRRDRQKIRGYSRMARPKVYLRIFEFSYHTEGEGHSLPTSIVKRMTPIPQTSIGSAL